MNDGLSAILIDVLQLAADGHSSPEIAAARGVTCHTIKRERTMIMDKLGADTITQAVAIALRRGIIK